MGKILSFFAGLIGIKALKLAIISFYFILVFAFYSFVMSSITYFYNLVHNFMSTDNISAYDGLSKFWGLLHCTGIVDGLIAGMPMLISALIFLFTIILFTTAFKIQGRIVDFTIKALN